MTSRLTAFYMKIRPGSSVRQRYDDARNVIIDLGADGEPVGYDIQFASKHADVIAEALALRQRGSQGTA